MEKEKSVLPDACLDCLFKSTCNQIAGQEENNFLFLNPIQQSYKKGEVIMKQGMKTNHLIYLHKGIVKFTYEDNNNKSLILAITKAPTLLGLANVLNEDINVFSILAIEECSGCLIDLNRLKMLMMSNRMFMLNIMKMSTGMFRKSIVKIISMAHKQTVGRIAEILIDLSNNVYQNDAFILSVSRQEFAEYAGCSKVNVIHTLQHFAAEGIIKVSGKKIEILNPERLMKISKIE
jgi:CRP-like cAMP-binding protein